MTHVEMVNSIIPTPFTPQIGMKHRFKWKGLIPEIGIFNVTSLSLPPSLVGPGVIVPGIGFDSLNDPKILDTNVTLNLYRGSDNTRASVSFTADNYIVQDIIDGINGSLAAWTTTPFAYSSIVGDKRIYLIDKKPSQNVHITSDAINVITSPEATDELSAITLANEIKTKYNTHRVGAFHTISDTNNIVTASNAGNLSTLISLISDLQIKITNHAINDGANYHVVPDSEDRMYYSIPTEINGAIKLINVIRTVYSRHLSMEGHASIEINIQTATANEATAITGFTGFHWGQKSTFVNDSTITFMDDIGCVFDVSVVSDKFSIPSGADTISLLIKSTSLENCYPCVLLMWSDGTNQSDGTASFFPNEELELPDIELQYDFGFIESEMIPNKGSSFEYPVEIYSYMFRDSSRAYFVPDTFPTSRVQEFMIGKVNNIKIPPGATGLRIVCPFAKNETGSPVPYLPRLIASAWASRGSL